MYWHNWCNLGFLFVLGFFNKPEKFHHPFDYCTSTSVITIHVWLNTIDIKRINESGIWSFVLLELQAASQLYLICHKTRLKRIQTPRPQNIILLLLISLLCLLASTQHSWAKVVSKSFPLQHFLCISELNSDTDRVM